MTMRGKRDEIVAAGVALAAFAASAQHIWSVTADAGNPGVIAALHPAGIDGLIYIGIRAMQRGKRRAGGFAVAYGAAYSLAFNAASYGAFAMPTWALAACMPLAMLFGFLIVHGGHVPAVVEPIVERVVETVTVPRELLPIVGPCLVPSVPVPSMDVRRVRPTSGGPARTWDVDKMVDMLQRGEPDASIMDVLDVSAKTVQRVKYIVRAVASGRADEDIVQPGNRPAALVQSVRLAMEG